MKLKTIYESVVKEKKEKQYAIYCDLDGVLVNFKDGVVDFINHYLDNLDQLPPDLIKLAKKAVKQTKINFNDFETDKKLKNFSYRLIEYKDIEFWSNLEWTKDGKKLWSVIKADDPIILSSPVGKSIGKYVWCKENLGYTKDRVILTKEKYKYANDKSILIDDMEKNTIPFKQHGGIAILHKSSSETINKLTHMIK